MKCSVDNISSADVVIMCASFTIALTDFTPSQSWQIVQRHQPARGEAHFVLLEHDMSR